MTLPGGGAAAGAFVVLVVQNGQSPGGAFTDASGNYTLYCQPGSYNVLPVLPGYLADTALSSVTVTANGGFVVNSQALVAGPLTLSGTLKDANSAAGLPAILIQAQSANLLAITFTDANGNYSAAITGNSTWQVKSEGQAAPQLGYLKNKNKLSITVGSSSVANVNLTLQPANALIYGVVSNSVGQAMLGVSMGAQDTSSLYEANGVTIGPDGRYSLGVLGGTGYHPGPNGDSLPAGYSAQSTNVTISAGQVVQANFLLTAPTAYLQGQIKDNFGNPIANQSITVQPYPINNNGGATSIYPQTDSNGNFLAGVQAGVWNIALECVSAQQSGYVNQTGPAYNFTVANGATNSVGVLAFPKSTATISGTVTDSHGNPLSGINMNANQNIDASNFYFPDCAMTDSGGHFSIKVLSGAWLVGVNTGSTYNSVANQNVSAGGTANFSLTAAATISISPPSLNNGTQGTAYSATLSASGGAGTYAWNFDRGWLPSGLFLNQSNGQISGTPGESGSFNFIVRATDGNGATTTMTYTLVIGAGSFQAPYFTNLTVTASSNPAGNLMSVAGQTYAIEASTNLTNWVAIENLTATNNLTALQANLAYLTNLNQIFYRGRIGRLFVTHFSFIHVAIGGTVNMNAPATVSFPLSINNYRADLYVTADPNSPDASQVIFTGPAGSGLSNTAADSQYSTITALQCNYLSPTVFTPSTGPGGTWTINDAGFTNIVLNVPDPQAASRLVIPVPTINVSGGAVQSVTWTYQNATTGAVLSQPPVYMTTIQVGILSGSSPEYFSPMIPASTTAFTLSGTPMQFSSVTQFFMQYYDTLGNTYVVSFNP
jgi:hypothetical protein